MASKSLSVGFSDRATENPVAVRAQHEAGNLLALCTERRMVVIVQVLQ